MFISTSTPTTIPQPTPTLPISHTSSTFSQLYQMSAPFMLEFETYCSIDDDSAFKMTILTPDFASHSMMTKTEFETRFSNRVLHQHNYYELLFVLEGEMYQTIEQQRHLYTKGCCCLLNKNIRHAEEFSSDFRVAFLAMSEEFLLDLFDDKQLQYFHVEQTKKETMVESFLYHSFTDAKHAKEFMDFIPTSSDDSHLFEMHALFDQLTKHLLNPVIGTSFLVKGLCFTILHNLENPKHYQTTPIHLGSEAEALLFRQITTLMEQTSGRISRNDLAIHFNYSGDYINKIVKKYTGLNIFDYGMTFCLKKAANLLINTSLTISNITIELGFSNRAHFYRLFEKNYQVTPKEYRIKHIKIEK